MAGLLRRRRRAETQGPAGVRQAEVANANANANASPTPSEPIRAADLWSVPDWLQVDPLESLLPEFPSTIKLAFGEDLATWRPPYRALEPLDHLVSDRAPNGTVEGLLNLRTSGGPERPPPAMPLAEHHDVHVAQQQPVKKSWPSSAAPTENSSSSFRGEGSAISAPSPSESMAITATMDHSETSSAPAPVVKAEPAHPAVLRTSAAGQGGALPLRVLRAEHAADSEVMLLPEDRTDDWTSAEPEMPRAATASPDAEDSSAGTLGEITPTFLSRGGPLTPPTPDGPAAEPANGGSQLPLARSVDAEGREAKGRLSSHGPQRRSGPGQWREAISGGESTQRREAVGGPDPEEALGETTPPAVESSTQTAQPTMPLGPPTSRDLPRHEEPSADPLDFERGERGDENRNLPSRGATGDRASESSPNETGLSTVPIEPSPSELRQIPRDGAPAPVPLETSAGEPGGNVSLDLPARHQSHDAGPEQRSNLIAGSTNQVARRPRLGMPLSEVPQTAVPIEDAGHDWHKDSASRASVPGEFSSGPSAPPLTSNATGPVQPRGVRLRRQPSKLPALEDLAAVDTRASAVSPMPLAMPPRRGPEQPPTASLAAHHPVRREVEQRMGVDLRDVAVDRSAEAGRTARVLGALAYTDAAGVHMPPPLNPAESAADRGTLAHELTHAAQRKLLGGWAPPEYTDQGVRLEAQARQIGRALGAKPPAADKRTLTHEVADAAPDKRGRGWAPPEYDDRGIRLVGETSLLAADLAAMRPHTSRLETWVTEKSGEIWSAPAVSVDWSADTGAVAPPDDLVLRTWPGSAQPTETAPTTLDRAQSGSRVAMVLARPASTAGEAGTLRSVHPTGLSDLGAPTGPFLVGSATAPEPSLQLSPPASTFSGTPPGPATGAVQRAEDEPATDATSVAYPTERKEMTDAEAEELLNQIFPMITYRLRSELRRERDSSGSLTGLY